MKIHPRHYSGPQDHPAMISLAHNCLENTLHVIDLPYRLSSWALDNPDYVSLWVDERGDLVAWAILQTPFWTVDFVVRPDQEIELLPQILSWIDQRARAAYGTPYGHPTWYVNVFAGQSDRRRNLELHGFIDQSRRDEDSWSKVWMVRCPINTVPDHPLPKGFSIRPLAGQAEVEAYVALHQAVFESKNMTVAWRLRTLKQPGYKPDLDLVVVAPDGQLAAFCIGWLANLDNHQLVGQVEPLGCHASFRNYALGRQALCEILRRLHALGAGEVFVETDSYRNTAFRLYESLGFKEVRSILVYRKDYNDHAG